MKESNDFDMTVAEANKACGKSFAVIRRAIQEGRLAAVKDNNTFTKVMQYRISRGSFRKWRAAVDKRAKEMVK